MARALALALVLLSGCVAAVDFGAFSRGAPSGAGTSTPADETRDGGTDAGALSDAGMDERAPPRLVQSSAAAASGAAAFGVNVAPTAAGDLLAVVIANEDFHVASVSSVTDDRGDVFVPTNEQSVDPSSGNSDEVWYTTAAAGVTKVQVRMTQTTSLELWALEVSGVTTLDTGAIVNGDGNKHGAIVAPKVTPSVARAFVLSSASTSASVAGPEGDSAFTMLAVQNGENAAYLVTNAVGSYGAAWSLSPNGTFNATTIAFR